MGAGTTVSEPARYDAAAFSFYPTKNLGAFGDAGMVVTRHAHVDDRIRSLRNLGSRVKNQHEERGTTGDSTRSRPRSCG